MSFGQGREEIEHNKNGLFARNAWYWALKRRFKKTIGLAAIPN